MSGRKASLLPQKALLLRSSMASSPSSTWVPRFLIRDFLFPNSWMWSRRLTPSSRADSRVWGTKTGYALGTSHTGRGDALSPLVLEKTLHAGAAKKELVPRLDFFLYFSNDPCQRATIGQRESI